ncbi:MAG: PDZ domain-containing protein [Desulfobacteraceae bacterium]|nr:PDZ domain-containing protein [Desulfobacteraceae bacterium]
MSEMRKEFPAACISHKHDFYVIIRRSDRTFTGTLSGGNITILRGNTITMKNILRICLVLMIIPTLIQCSHLGGRQPSDAAVPPVERSIIRVHITRQGYFHHRPWQLHRPSNRSAIGVVLSAEHILVTALPLANHRYIELEKIDSREKSRAEVMVIDYEANLALLKPETEGFLSDRVPMALTNDTREGDSLELWQIKRSGEVLPIKGTVASIELSAYPLDHSFLAYKLNTRMQGGFIYATLPVVKKNKLAGMLQRYDSQSQTIDIIPEPVISHFLADAADGHYSGFPIAGFGFSALNDPQLRRYEAIPDNIGGIYVQSIIKGGPADGAGLSEGDIVTRIGGVDLSNYGRYDHPFYGRISIQHLIRCGYQVGDTLDFTVFRNGEQKNLSMVLDHRGPQEYLVPPYIIDTPPRYYISGGLVLQELSTTFLREYGSDWSAKAPINLVFFNQNQDYLDPSVREKIVFLSSVIPTSYTIGFEDLTNLVVTGINNRKIRRLEDVPEAFRHPVDGFHKVEFDQHPRVVYLDPDQLPDIHRQITQRYGIDGNFVSPTGK